ncbi:hypothetical protein AB1N83_010604 [Pleurotus pulmonarius]|nr:hypothetical protein EYR38_010713 [Pleurotus pulmonarius]
MGLTVPVELLSMIFKFVSNTSTLLSLLLSSRTLHSIAEPILYDDVVLRLLQPILDSSFHRFLKQIDRHRAALVRHLTIDIEMPTGTEAHADWVMSYPADIESLLLKLTPKLRSFTLTDTIQKNTQIMHRLCASSKSPLPSTLSKLQVCRCTSATDIQFALFLSHHGNFIEHLDMLPRGPSVLPPGHPALRLSKQALPSLRILGAYTLSEVFCHLDGVRNLTHLKLGSQAGMDPGAAVDMCTYARHLVNVKTFACTLEYPVVSPLVAMLTGLERLDVHITGRRDIDFLMVDRDANKGAFQNVKMLRVSSYTNLHSDDFVPWAFIRFPGLQSLEVPCAPHAAPRASDRRRSVFRNPILEPGDLFYRFRNAVDTPSLVRWECRAGDEWFCDWEKDVTVVVKSVGRGEYNDRLKVERS